MEEKKYRVGFTDGVFDLFHVGHLNIIETAKRQCDFLIVGVHSDEIVEAYKHRKPVIRDVDRKSIVEAVRYVDKAVINETRDKIELWKQHHFDAIFVGDDWKGSERWNNYERIFKEINVDVIYVPYTKGISTTEIIRQMIRGQAAEE
jgi:glycerol-3-phosphate cytidylyltransferase